MIFLKGKPDQYIPSQKHETPDFDWPGPAGSDLISFCGSELLSPALCSIHAGLFLFLWDLEAISHLGGLVLALLSAWNACFWGSHFILMLSWWEMTSLPEMSSSQSISSTSPASPTCPQLVPVYFLQITYHNQIILLLLFTTKSQHLVRYLPQQINLKFTEWTCKGQNNSKKKFLLIRLQVRKPMLKDVELLVQNHSVTKLF